MAGFRHVVTLAFDPGAVPAQHEAVVEGLRGLPAVIPEIAGYEIGVDAGLDDANASLVVVADFASVDDYETYRDHEAHRRVIDDHIRPILVSRSAVQHHRE